MSKIADYKVLTLTHQQAKLQDIGKFVLADSDQDETLSLRLNELKTQFQLDELLYVATCNRVLFVFTTSRPIDRQSFIVPFFSAINNTLSREELNFVADEALLMEGKDAVMHLFEVGASMNSLVVGEREILRQLREQYERCVNIKSTDDMMRIAMRFTVEASKAVYNYTKIGEKSVSVVSLALQSLMTHSPSLDSRVLVVGAGQTNSLVVKLLQKQGFHNFAIFNRTLARAQELAETVNAPAYTLDELSTYRQGFDIMVVCTGSTEHVIGLELYRKLLAGDTSSKVVIDLSVPNNVSGEVVMHHAVSYIEIEDLRQLAQANMEFRQQEISKAKDIVNQHWIDFEEHFRHRQISKALSVVPERVKAVKQRAINEIFHKELAELDDNTLTLINRMMDYMERGCINEPMKAAKEALSH